jgi:hypothetical protein
MAVYVDALQFYSGYPIDKIVTEGTISDTVTYSFPYGTKVVTLPNPYGIKALVNASFTTDDTNYYEAGTFTVVYDPGAAQAGIVGSVIVGVSNSNIYFVLFNGITGTTKTIKINYAVYSIS